MPNSSGKPLIPMFRCLQTTQKPHITVVLCHVNTMNKEMFKKIHDKDSEVNTSSKIATNHDGMFGNKVYLQLGIKFGKVILLMWCYN